MLLLTIAAKLFLANVCFVAEQASLLMSQHKYKVDGPRADASPADITPDPGPISRHKTGLISARM